MVMQEEKIIKWLKITFLFLFTVLALLLLGDSYVLILLVFYMAFIKDFKK